MLRKYEQRLPWQLDWNLLRTFMVVVDEGGITPAANFLGLKQPTISAALMRLEDSFGCKLINRSPTHFSVTPRGQVLYAEARSVFGTVSQLPNLMSGLDDEVSGHISIAVASHVVSSHFDAVLEQFNAHHPQVTYSFLTLESAEVLADVQQNRVTLGVCLLEDNSRKLDQRILYREYFGFYCGPKHRLFGRKDIPVSELRDEYAVSFETDETTGPLFGVAALRVQLGLQPGLKGISSSLLEVRRMIISNIGIGALPVHVARRDVAQGLLWQLPPYTALPAIDIHVVTNPKRTMNRAEVGILSLLQTTLEETSLSARTYS
ncbi:LysR family transcriptional regulator [Pseudorhodobacter turbinis]|uniref:LysR family transcriptional regulator n=1 Tax=Pseudorhodobacter turbinis TaxID=2500533 RepID=A0A4P8EFQ5_9RHOB|nr:LysR family transcriptional regulator [Pseudorhodobacter turbinis]QCO55706.1 LysR family transcriptional regulator [Pseudorhodobacter turbinis]